MDEISSGWALEWATSRDAGERPVSRQPLGALEELAKLLDALDAWSRANHPIIAEIVAPNGASMGIGLGRPQSALVFKTGPVDPPYYTSVGGTHRGADDDDPSGVFYYQGTHTELPLEALVLRSVARDAAMEFFRTGERPRVVDWEEV